MNFKFTKNNLNFNVYTVAEKPSSPGVENDIAIITSVSMPNWIMSPDEPSGIPRSDGDVWIRYSVTGNTFNALKNNSMMIATISAWQYVDGAWAEVEAVSCQNGEWVEWFDGRLFDYGYCNNIKWKARAWSYSSSYTALAPTITNNTDGSVTIYIPSGSYSGVYEIMEDIDLTQYSSLYFKGHLTIGGTNKNLDRFRIGLVNRDAKYYGTDMHAYGTFAATGEGEITVDISSLSGKYDIAAGIATKSDSGSYTVRMDRVILS